MSFHMNVYEWGRMKGVVKGWGLSNHSLKFLLSIWPYSFMFLITVKKGEDRYCLYFDKYLAGFIALASLS